LNHTRASPTSELTDAQNWLIPIGKVKPLVSGPSTDELHALIARLKTEIGCN
jgi:hypothetical protein